MITRGITTTEANFWVHLFPLEYAAYWYTVRHMQEWLKKASHVERIGRSKDGSETGAGYLVKKDTPFIRRVTVPKKMIDAFSWRDATDRQIGLLWGEQVIDWMITTNALHIPYFTASRLDKFSEQLSMGDFGIKFCMPTVLLLEVKTEVIDSGNLFVQTKEGWHKVHQVNSRDGNVQHRYIPANSLQ